MKNLIAISGRIGSGKDTVGEIVNYLHEEGEWNNFEEYVKMGPCARTWEIKKYAGRLKDMVCLLINCTRDQLEDATFKNTELGEEWWNFDEVTIKNWLLTEGFSREHIDTNKSVFLDNYKRSPVGITKLTPRRLLQKLGTECGRNIHTDIWVNTLFSDYKSTLGIKHKLAGEDGINEDYEPHEDDIIDVFPNWIITDMRFPNELEAVKKRNGITIRVNRSKEREMFLMNATTIIDTRLTEHPSETALDDAEFNYIVENNGTIEELIEKVRIILKTENIL